MRIEFTENNQDHISALLGLEGMRWLRDAVGARPVDYVSIYSPDELLSHIFTINANGHNSSGQFLIRKGTEVRSVPWNVAYEHRKQAGMKDAYRNSPQTELDGSEDAVAVLQDHAKDHDTASIGVSIRAFICPKDTRFCDIPRIKVWLAEPVVISKLTEIGL